MQRGSEHDFFNFSKKERNGIVILSIINLLLIAAPYFYEKTHSNEKYLSLEYDSLSFDNTRSELENVFSRSDNHTTHKSFSQNNVEKKQNRLFDFDPNTISEAQWEELGVYPKTISTITKYIQKGGRFRKPEDLKKIWGLSLKKAEELIPYVSIKEVKNQNNENQIERHLTVTKNELIELNSSDSARLEKLPGIGPKLSQRIIMYREKLGGFHSKEQLSEVFGLKDSLIKLIAEKVVVDAGKIRKLNINKADKDALKNHPYIRYKIADAIINYRSQHGDFTTIDQLKNIVLIDEITFKKLKLYLTVN